MLFWIFVVALTICIVGVVWAVHNRREELWWVLGILITGAAVLLSVVIMLCNHIDADAKIERWNAQYESLVYQYENNIYENDNDLGKKGLYSEIQSWNMNLSYKKEVQDNFWIGIYYPNVFDQFELIELK